MERPGFAAHVLASFAHFLHDQSMRTPVPLLDSVM
jgi:hypothetical protein